MSEFYQPEMPEPQRSPWPRLRYRLVQVATAVAILLAIDAHALDGAIRRQAVLEIGTQWREAGYLLRRQLDRIRIGF